jgi:hypothetical protein
MMASVRLEMRVCLMRTDDSYDFELIEVVGSGLLSTLQPYMVQSA